MFEFVGAIAGRSIIYEGTLNDSALIGAALGIGMVQIVTSYTKESSLAYYFITFKFIVYWLLLSSVLGMISLLFGVKTDPNPKTRAWLNGPHLNGFMRATREIGSCILSVFFPMNPEYEKIIQNGLGWNGFYVSLISLYIMTTLIELLNDSFKVSQVKETPIK